MRLTLLNSRTLCSACTVEGNARLAETSPHALPLQGLSGPCDASPPTPSPHQSHTTPRSHHLELREGTGKKDVERFLNRLVGGCCGWLVSLYGLAVGTRVYEGGSRRTAAFFFVYKSPSSSCCIACVPFCSWA